MQVTSEELRRHYASLSDEEIEEIDPEGLTEAARKCYEREVEARGLTGDEAPPGAREDAGEDVEESFETEPDWLDHAACACSYTAFPGSSHAPDAARARDALLAAGVPCHLSVSSPDRESDDPQAYDEYRVLVPESLHLKATSVLDKEIFNAQLEADWRAHFASLSEQELREVKPEVVCAGLLDRVDRLTRAYRDEIARRKAG